MTGRVVSLVPSVTESLLAWGVVPVACTRFCEQPDLVHVGGTKDPDIDAIVSHAPSLVVVDREENRRDDAEAAFGFASPGIRSLFGTSGTFMDMVRQGYQPVYRPQVFEFREIVDLHGLPTQKVHVIGPDGRPVTAEDVAAKTTAHYIA